MRPRVRFVSGGVVHSSFSAYGGTDPVSGRRRWLTRTVHCDRSDAIESSRRWRHTPTSLRRLVPRPPSVHSSINGSPMVEQRGRPPPSAISHRSLNATSSPVSVTSWWATSEGQSWMSSRRTCAQKAGSRASLWQLAPFGVSTLRSMRHWPKRNAGPGSLRTSPITQPHPEESRPGCGRPRWERWHIFSTSSLMTRTSTSI